MRALVLAFILVAGPVLAQEAPVATAPPALPVVPPPPALDPLGDLITQTGNTDEEDEAPPATPVPRHKPTLLPIPEPEPPEVSYPPEGDHAVPMGTYIPSERAYELRVKGSIVAAQGLQGPLDGGWKVAGPDGAPLYALQIVDPAGGAGPLEGAWRDVRRPGAVGSTGLIETVERAGQTVVFRFNPRPDQTSVLTLSPGGGPRWSGSLYEAGLNQAVTAEREAPPSLPPGYVIQGRGPVIWGAPRAASTSATPAKAVSCSTRGKTGKALKAAKAKCAVAARKGGKASTLKSKKGSKAKATAGKKKPPAKRKPKLR